MNEEKAKTHLFTRTKKSSEKSEKKFFQTLDKIGIYVIM